MSVKHIMYCDSFFKLQDKQQPLLQHNSCQSTTCNAITAWLIIRTMCLTMQPVQSRSPYCCLCCSYSWKHLGLSLTNLHQMQRLQPDTASCHQHCSVVAAAPLQVAVFSSPGDGKSPVPNSQEAAQFHCIHLLRVMVKLLPSWLPDILFSVLQDRWNSQQRLKRCAII